MPVLHISQLEYSRTKYKSCPSKITTMYSTIYYSSLFLLGYPVPSKNTSLEPGLMV